ncbi:MAG TPA: tRNA pseudouridine(13) synthase TruD, partial [Planctomycetia bacterium]|nr:tRNA pseudouridine(13) synthase TruD [Planctomycetia bacterium]
DPDVAPAIEANLAAIATSGLPNYFDDQRFGSRTSAGDFVAVPWCRGDFETALKFALAEPSDRDRSDDRRAKERLRARWGDWSGVLRHEAEYPFPVPLRFLADRPGDFSGAFVRLPHDLRSLFLNAFQSWLWNRLLSESLPPDDNAMVEIGGEWLRFPRSLEADSPWRNRNLLLPSAREKFPPGPEKEALARILSEVGLEERELRVKTPRENFFSKGERAAWFFPQDFAWKTDVDERYPGRRKIVLTFRLPRGAYATILVKRLELAAG